MDRYAYLVKKRNKHIGAFQKVAVGLDKVNKEISKELENNSLEKDHLELSLESNKADRKFLLDEMENNADSIKKIGEIFPVLEL